MKLLRPLLPVAAFALLAGAAHAQVYRIVGPDGRVSFSDKPPASANQPVSSQRSAGIPVPASAPNGLPYELNQTAQKYPVTLYTGADCSACTQGRAYLNQRGIPYVEKTVSTNEDIAALQKLSGGNTIPTLTIGGQRLTGFSGDQWGKYLDAAGYPKTSQLPASYKRPAPTALAGGKAAAPATPAAKGEGAAASSDARNYQPPSVVPDGPTSDNPAGIRF